MEITCSEHVAVSNGLHFVDAKLVHKAVKGVVQVGKHEEDLHCRHGCCHGAEAHDVTEEDDHMLMGVPNDLMPILLHNDTAVVLLLMHVRVRAGRGGGGGAWKW